MAVMTSYDFTQQVDYPNLLIENIQASSIATPVVPVLPWKSPYSLAMSYLVLTNLL